MAQFLENTRGLLLREFRADAQSALEAGNLAAMLDPESRCRLVLPRCRPCAVLPFQVDEILTWTENLSNGLLVLASDGQYYTEAVFTPTAIEGLQSTETQFNLTQMEKSFFTASSYRFEIEFTRTLPSNYIQDCLKVLIMIEKCNEFGSGHHTINQPQQLVKELKGLLQQLYNSWLQLYNGMTEFHDDLGAAESTQSMDSLLATQAVDQSIDSDLLPDSQCVIPVEQLAKLNDLEWKTVSPQEQAQASPISVLSSGASDHRHRPSPNDVVQTQHGIFQSQLPEFNMDSIDDAQGSSGRAAEESMTQFDSFLEAPTPEPPAISSQVEVVGPISPSFKVPQPDRTQMVLTESSGSLPSPMDGDPPISIQLGQCSRSPSSGRCSGSSTISPKQLSHDLPIMPSIGDSTATQVSMQSLPSPIRSEGPLHGPSSQHSPVPESLEQASRPESPDLVSQVLHKIAPFHMTQIVPGTGSPALEEAFQEEETSSAATMKQNDGQDSLQELQQPPLQHSGTQRVRFAASPTTNSSPLPRIGALRRENEFMEPVETQFISQYHLFPFESQIPFNSQDDTATMSHPTQPSLLLHLSPESQRDSCAFESSSVPARGIVVNPHDFLNSQLVSPSLLDPFAIEAASDEGNTRIFNNHPIPRYSPEPSLDQSIDKLMTSPPRPRSSPPIRSLPPFPLEKPLDRHPPLAHDVIELSPLPNSSQSIVPSTPMVHYSVSPPMLLSSNTFQHSSTPPPHKPVKNVTLVIIPRRRHRHRRYIMNHDPTLPIELRPPPEYWIPPHLRPINPG